jgi:hypothetical protein
MLVGAAKRREPGGKRRSFLAGMQAHGTIVFVMDRFCEVGGWPGSSRGPFQRKASLRRFQCFQVTKHDARDFHTSLPSGWFWQSHFRHGSTPCQASKSAVLTRCFHNRHDMLRHKAWTSVVFSLPYVARSDEIAAQIMFRVCLALLTSTEAFPVIPRSPPSRRTCNEKKTIRLRQPDTDQSHQSTL